ncbi:hypothetical protein C2E20_6550 [Micractinium conductrix]|uniref:Protein SirB1 N-terminal domain-containing protein n=1 Tax=Micractinium conductrix TaxID=554055 RepID=A0A2P6V7G3_9CHLO|nr:hypothetical protein C2E20_6550 [Micractinium conductrix]|eukprot:PSC70018.1 hypothetical protein C2E20_6550 [Micractinium conductrix]
MASLTAAACLLLALEEEAAAQAITAYADAEGWGPDTARLGSVGSAGTWSLERIESLAEEAARAFYIKLQELGWTEGVAAAAAARADASDSTLLAFHLDLVRSYPTQLILAINHVLFERHGYRRQRRHGDPLDSRLSNVLENGNGSPGSLAVLYLELCGRMGLALEPVALEGGRYFVLMPADNAASLSVAGERFVIDPYSEGLLMSEAEICELFEVGEGGLQPCSFATMLAGILTVLRDSHWCAAVGCPPEPLLMVPVSVEVALGEYRDVEVSTSSGEDEAGVPTFRVSFSESPTEAEVPTGRQWWPAEGYHLQRALAAAQKRAWLLPDDLHALLDYALCLYFSKQYEDAWQELGCVLQAAKGEPLEAATFGEREVEQMELLWEKMRLQLAFAGS